MATTSNAVSSSETTNDIVVNVSDYETPNQPVNPPVDVNVNVTVTVNH